MIDEINRDKVSHAQLFLGKAGHGTLPLAVAFVQYLFCENKQATGAGADRVSQGMRCAFGKNVGTAARVKRGQRVISIQFKPENYLVAKDALRKASMKFPTPCTVRLIKGHEHLKGLI